MLLLVYKRWILNQAVHWRQLSAAFIVFMFLQAFHIVPQIASMVTPGSVLYTAVFSSSGKFDRGLGYFSSIAPSIKTSINVLLLPQMMEVSKLLIFMIMLLLTVILGLLRSGKEEQRFKKTFLLIGALFIVIFFFATGNITDLGLSVYKNYLYSPDFLSSVISMDSGRVHTYFIMR